MRRHITLLAALAFLLSAMGLMAQTSSSARQHPTKTTTTTTTTTQQVSGPQHSVEGCVMKEASDFFLIPARGNPIELQPASGQDLSAHEGHKVRVRGVETSLNASNTAGTGATGGAAGTATSTTTKTPNGTQSSTTSVSQPAGSTSSSNAGTTSGTGNDLHQLATKQMTVANLDHLGDTCPVNWNPRVSTPKK